VGEDPLLTKIPHQGSLTSGRVVLLVSPLQSVQDPEDVSTHSKAPRSVFAGVAVLKDIWDLFSLIRSSGGERYPRATASHTPQRWIIPGKVG